jgi:hypothetical protein
LAVSDEPNLLGHVQRAIEALDDTKPRSFSGFVLENNNSALISSTSQVVHGETLYFYSPQVITPVSSGSWTAALLKQLKVKIVGMDQEQFLQAFDIIDDNLLSERAQRLVEELKDVNTTFLEDYKTECVSRKEEMRESAIHCHALVKALFLIRKYLNCEALVDSFVNNLLSALGFNDGMLYVVPQFKMTLHFGGESNDKESIPDFLVMDILSYLKMVIVEDKNHSLYRCNSFPQLFAELVAMFAINQCKVEQASKRPRTEVPSQVQAIKPSYALGVRVNGTIFHFHGVAPSNSIFTAMESLQEAKDTTTTIRLGNEEGYDFMIPSQRMTIIYILDKFASIFNERTDY